MLLVLGVYASFFVVFPSFVMAAIVATIGPIPLGLGTFELTSVTMLKSMAIPMEAALATTLMLRGFTVWMPMIPRMRIARRALRSTYSPMKTHCFSGIAKT
ncbi:MAG: flippase-like domain-containing protein [Deltaproteobacteria bacterium]|nr:flippase-like domain-containing protein [Deltaproteobacteria bacterium]